MQVMVWLPPDEEEPAAVLEEASRLAGKLDARLCVLHVGASQEALADAVGAVSWFISGEPRREALLRFARSQRSIRLVLGPAARRRWGNAP